MNTLRWLLCLPPGGSSFADGIDLLHAFVISVTMISSFVVFGVATWFTVRYLRRKKTLTPRVTVSPLKETFLVGGILGLFLVWWVIGYGQYVDMQTPPKDAYTVYVTAKQWMWKFEYPDGASSNDVLVVPAGKDVRLVMMSRDVIHSFYVPAFRTKQDVLPGRYTTLWFNARPGTYPIRCAEYCGVSHSRMKGEVRVLPEDAFAEWLATHRTSEGEDRTRLSEMAARGAEIAARRGCLSCHTLDGQPHVGPTWSRLYGSQVPLSDGRVVVADDAYLTRSMMEPEADRVAGYKAIMPTYFGQLSPSETSAIVELIRSLREGAVPTGVALPRIDVEVQDGGAP